MLYAVLETLVSPLLKHSNDDSVAGKELDIQIGVKCLHFQLPYHPKSKPIHRFPTPV